MKVICINGVKRGELNCEGEHPLQEDKEVYEGEVYTVVSQNTYPGCEFPFGQYYILAEKGNNVGYGIYGFAPCSEIDETEYMQSKVVNEKPQKTF